MVKFRSWSHFAAPIAGLLLGGFAPAQAAEIVKAIPVISTLPQEFQAGLKTTEQMHQKMPATARALGPSGINGRIAARYAATKLAVGGGLNETQEYRSQAMRQALRDKVVPHFHELMEVSKRLQVEPKAILLGILTENTLATNNSASKLGVAVSTWKTLDHALSFHSELRKYAENMALCDAGQWKGRGTRAPRDILGALGLPKDDCTVCRKNFEHDSVYLFPCYWAFLGEAKVPGGTLSTGGKKASGFGPGQLHLENALLVIDIPGLFGEDGALEQKRPKDWIDVLEAMDDRIFDMRGAWAIIGAMMRAAQLKYLEKGWDISADYPVLVTMYHIGNIGFHAAEAEPPGGKYYPTTDFFGTYSVLIEGIVDEVVAMGIDVELRKREWDMKKISDLAGRTP